MYMTFQYWHFNFGVALQNFYIIRVYSAAQNFHSAKQSQQMVDFLFFLFQRLTKKKVFFLTDKIKVKRMRVMFSSTDYIRLFYTSGFATY